MPFLAPAKQRGKIPLLPGPGMADTGPRTLSKVLKNIRKLANEVKKTKAKARALAKKRDKLGEKAFGGIQTRKDVPQSLKAKEFARIRDKRREVAKRAFETSNKARSKDFERGEKARGLNELFKGLKREARRAAKKRLKEQFQKETKRGRKK